jgi:hypothetical protein
MIPTLLGSAIGAGIGYFSDQEEAEAKNKAFLQGKQLDIAAKERAIEKSADFLTSETPTARTTRQPSELGGGFKVEALGPEKALFGTPAGGFEGGPTGDFLRAANVNVASARPPTYPSLQAAIADAEESVAQQRTQTKEDIIEPYIAQQQRTLGPGHSGIAEATFRNPAIQQVFSNMPIAKDVGRKRYNEQNVEDQKLVQLILANNALRARNLTAPTGAASVIPANIPIPEELPDYEDAIEPAARSNFVKQLVMANAAAQAGKTTDERLRQILLASGRQLPEQVARPTPQPGGAGARVTTPTQWV